MSAGTLALTNGSTAVTGSGTVFQTDLAPNDFIVCKIGGTTYTLGVSTIGSNTALTLTQPFTGPTTSGVAWYAVPNQTLVGITTELAANLTSVYRSVLVNDANWTKVFSQSGNITVTLKDGSTYTGPSWNSITTSLNAKANTADVLTKADNLNSLANKATARTNLGLGNSALRDVGVASGTVAAGDDSRLTTLNGKTGGTVSSRISVSASDFGLGKLSAGWNSSANLNQLWICEGLGSSYFAYMDYFYSSTTQYEMRMVVQGVSSTRVFEWRDDGTFRSPGTVYAAGTALTSDARLKSNFEDVDYDIDLIDKIIPKYYDKRLPDDPETVTRELGIVAQSLQVAIPGLVSKFYWSEEYPDLLTVNYAGLSAWLTGYCKHLKDRVVKQDADIAELQKRMKSIDGLDA